MNMHHITGRPRTHAHKIYNKDPRRPIVEDFTHTPPNPIPGIPNPRSHGGRYAETSRSRLCCGGSGCCAADDNDGWNGCSVGSVSAAGMNVCDATDSITTQTSSSSSSRVSVSLFGISSSSSASSWVRDVCDATKPLTGLAGLAAMCVRVCVYGLCCGGVCLSCLTWARANVRVQSIRQRVNGRERVCVVYDGPSCEFVCRMCCSRAGAAALTVSRVTHYTNSNANIYTLYIYIRTHKCVVLQPNACA